MRHCVFAGIRKLGWYFGGRVRVSLVLNRFSPVFTPEIDAKRNEPSATEQGLSNTLSFTTAPQSRDTPAGHPVMFLPS